MDEAKEVLTLPGLVKVILKRWAEKQKEALEVEAEEQKILTGKAKREQALVKEWEASKLIVSRMQADYLKLELKIEAENRKRIETAAIRESDVKSGKVTLTTFLKKGKSAEQISKEVIEKSMAELQTGLVAIRSKNLENLKLELKLSELKLEIRFALTQPTKNLQKSIRDLLFFSEQELSTFIDEIHASKSELTRITNKHTLAVKGQALAPGYTWYRLPLSKARLIQFDAALPESLVGLLRIELAKLKGDKLVNVTYYIQSQSIDVSEIPVRDEK